MCPQNAGPSLDGVELDSLTLALARAAAAWFVKQGNPVATGAQVERRERYITTSELALATGTSPRTVLNWLESGQVPGARRTPRGYWRVPADSAERILQPDNGGPDREDHASKTRPRGHD